MKVMLEPRMVAARTHRRREGMSDYGVNPLKARFLDFHSASLDEHGGRLCHEQAHQY